MAQDLRDAILEAVTDTVETFNYGIPAIALVVRRKRDRQIMIAGFKNHVAMYPHPTVIEKLEKELSAFNKRQRVSSVSFEQTST